MDTTLRDGEQTNGVSFMPHEKLMICRALLEDLHVDRVEVASARVSDGELEAVQRITRWAASKDLLDRVEVLGFVDDGKSLDWIERAGARTLNILCKGSRRHCEGQLGKSLEEHAADIRRNVEMAAERGIKVNLYLEDWSGGMKRPTPNPSRQGGEQSLLKAVTEDSHDNDNRYVFQLLDSLIDLVSTSQIHLTPSLQGRAGGGSAVGWISRIMLPDTLGILNPLETLEFMRQMVERYPGVHFDFHAHNDYDLAVSNVLAAVLGGAQGLHTSINGLGERAGNAPLASVQAILKDHFNARTHICEEQLNRVAHLVESYSGIAIPPNKPITGSAVFTQVAGVHADGDNKSGLYQNALKPERFGRRREYALGKASGKANVLMNLKELGLDLSDEDMKKVTDRIIELGDKKELVTQEDLPYIIRDVLKHSENDDRVHLLSYMVSTAYGLRPMAQVRLQIDDHIYEESAQGDGQYDAFVRAVRHIYRDRLGRKFPWLSNYAVTIPPGGRTDALVQTTIEWVFEDKTFRTHALDADQTEAAIKATIKLLNIIEPLY
ncbi:MAG: 2-isopropylmalate synthase [Bacteroidaceae bacterium]|nr:2-isopropylmalate synthase [Bacteroidaceae bacterium]MBR1801304.1 2-isopropylmalate synthase [Bacteroidaceae bacterium]